MTPDRDPSDAPLSAADGLRLPKPPGIFRQYFARHPWLVDGAVLVVVMLPAAIYLPLRLLGLTGETNSLVGGILAVASTVGVGVALCFRRTHPIVLVVAVGISFFLVLPDFGGIGMAAPLIALYAVAVYASARAAWISCGALVATLFVSSLVTSGINLFQASGTSLTLGFLMLIATLVGINVGNRTRYVQALLDRAAQLARERDQQAQLSAAAERARIAREMHDVVAHSLTVMIALADGADLTVTRDPDRARDAIRLVAETGRTALADMRVVLGVLAEPAVDASAPVPAGAVSRDLAPQPGHDDFAGLVESFRAAGMSVSFTVAGEVWADTGIQLAVYRIVQEALTNALRYAPVPKRVTVVIEYAAAVVTATVDDVAESTTAAPDLSVHRQASVGSGRGVVGMRQRAEAHGGVLDAGPQPTGGWRVRAVLPRPASLAVTPVAVSEPEPVPSSVPVPVERSKQ